MRPITKFVFKLIYNGNISHAFKKVIPSLSHSISHWNYYCLRNLFFEKPWCNLICDCAPAESFHRILGIHVIKAFSEDCLSCFGHKIELCFNYHNLFLLKKQKQYAQKFNCVRLYRALIWHSKTTFALKEYIFGRTEFSEIYFCDWMGIKIRILLDLFSQMRCTNEI